jgi:acetyl-CoA carboxylase carboxyl transferase subunit alpha
MLSNSIYSVISPDGCASILWRDAKFAPDAAKALNLTAHALMKHEVIDEIIPEPQSGAHENYLQTARTIKRSVIKNLCVFNDVSSEEIIQNRFEKYAAMGKFTSMPDVF